ncbi:MAG TPA: FAD-dependent monooxygenase [Pseudonocardia sp.]|nr:FAD-dependent monooxygenase [Pseudonocardia sp.]
MDTDVIVIGAGPAGLMLATELGLAGVPTVLLEALPTPSSQSKGGGLQPRTCEVLELRGLLAPVLEHALPREPVGGHFAALPVELDCRPWHTRHPYPVSVPQAAVQAVLAEVAGRRGVAVRSGHRVTAVHQDADGVVVTACTGDGGGELRATARYAVACDGAHSTVRRLLDAPFPGEPGTRTSTVADLRLTPGSAPTPARDGHMSSLVHTGGGYWTMLSRADGGRHRLVYGTLDPTAGPARDAPVTPSEVADVLRAVHGPARLGELFETSRFTDATRQLASYRHGRVLFAGDAAHVHPPLGGQGLNLGIHDAMNLGWKLAATVSGTAPNGLLDSYHDERHPVGAGVLAHTRAQRVLAERRPTPDVVALRDLVTELLRLPDTNAHLAGLMSGLGLRYPMPGQPEGPLVGARMPDLSLSATGRGGRVSDLLWAGRPVLLDLRDDPGLADLPALPGVARVTAKTAEELAAGAVLIRPDGYVCWAAPPGPLTEADLALLHAAAARWCARPRP